MRYLPIHLNLRNIPCLVVGGGKVAAGKVLLLLRAGAQVHIVTLATSDEMKTLQASHSFPVHERAFTDSDLDSVRLVIAATADPTLNNHITVLANQKGILANAVTDAEAGQFIMPAVVDRDPVLVSISTAGTSPALSRALRARLEMLLPQTLGQLATLAGEFRAQVKNVIVHPGKRRAFWDRLLQGPIAEHVHTGHIDKARHAIIESLSEAKTHQTDSPVGEVYLVGAGPGDPELLTLRAMRLLQQADVVVYDRLVSSPVLDLVRRDAERIYAGKQRNQHTLAQNSINTLLVRLAKQGKRVLRLKGGDPFVFGRGGEEIAALVEENIPFQVVPGITAALGCAAYAGIPLTHRDHAHTCIFVTGHLKDHSVDLNWSVLCQPQQTIVFYMGYQALPVICRELIAHGLPKTTPCALIQQGTTALQQVSVATLESASEKTQDILSPSLLIVGQVVILHKQLNWFAPSGPANDSATIFS